MKRILFVTLGHLSGGEFTIASEFAKRLSKEEFKVLFLTSAKGTGYLKANSLEYVELEKTTVENLYFDREKNFRKICEVLDEYKPDLAIESDVYTMWYSFSWTGMCNELFKERNIPFGSFDSYEFGSTDYVQDYYGGYKAVLPKLMEECDFVIRYCPINKISIPNCNIKYTYLYDKAVEPAGAEERYRIEFNKIYRPTGDEKIIFMTNSNWEQLNIYRFPALTNLMNWIPDIIMNYISDLKQNVTVIHVGGTGYQEKVNFNIKYFHLPFAEPDEFDRLLRNSDLYLTTNVISSTLVKAVYCKVPAVCLCCDKYIDFTKLWKSLKSMPEWYNRMAQEVKMVYPFRLFPFGWFKFLTNVLEDNEYCNTFVTVNMFQYKKVLNTLDNYLNDAKEIGILREEQGQYVKKLLKLPSSDAVIHSILEG